AVLQSIPEVEPPEQSHKYGKHIAHHQVNARQYEKQNPEASQNLSDKPYRNHRHIILETAEKVRIQDFFTPADLIGYQKETRIKRPGKKYSKNKGKIGEIEGKCDLEQQNKSGIADGK